MTFELWESGTGNLTYFARNEHYNKTRALLEPDAVKIWEYGASSYFDAMQAYYNNRGWGTYTPEPDWQDESYE